MICWNISFTQIQFARPRVRNPLLESLAILAFAEPLGLLTKQDDQTVVSPDNSQLIDIIGVRAMC